MPVLSTGDRRWAAVLGETDTEDKPIKQIVSQGGVRVLGKSKRGKDGGGGALTVSRTSGRESSPLLMTLRKM